MEDIGLLKRCCWNPGVWKFGQIRFQIEDIGLLKWCCWNRGFGNKISNRRYWPVEMLLLESEFEILTDYISNRRYWFSEMNPGVWKSDKLDFQ